MAHRIISSILIAALYTALINVAVRGVVTPSWELMWLLWAMSMNIVYILAFESLAVDSGNRNR